MTNSETETSTDIVDVLEKTVNDLYDYRDYYFINNSVEAAADFHSNLKTRLLDTVSKLEDSKDEAMEKNRARYFYLLGKANNIEGEFSPKAEECLSRALKLNPNLVDAWNHLGDSYFKKGNYTEAKNCFTNALNREKNKVSMRNLSVVLRKISGQTKEEYMENINAGLKYAQDALEMDPNDGISWFFMGNAYMSLFFTDQQIAKTLSQAMDAYNRSENDKASKSNPDLYYNKGVALKFQEEYEKALLNFEKAFTYDPKWDTPKEVQERLVKYLTTLQDLVSQKARVKNKKLQKYISTINPEKHLGHFQKLSSDKQESRLSLKYTPLAKLNIGMNNDKVVIGTVLCSVQNEDLVPFTFCMVDTESTCIGVTVYNLAQGHGVIMGDVVAIGMPVVKETDFTFKDKKLHFKSIRISNPLLLAINGKPVPSYKMSSIQMATFSEADNKI